jgi:DNA-binding NtrC family response regulator
MAASRPPHNNLTDRIDVGAEGGVPSLRPAAHQRRLSLVVFHAEGTEVTLLEPGVPVVVGRQAPATVCVPSTKLSREHARFTLDLSGHVKVEDLGSTNGTWIRGTRVDVVEISLGEEVVLGGALAYLQVIAPEERSSLAPGTREAGGDDDPIAVAPAMREALATAERIAASSVSVILHGETGTGKEVLARFLHERGPRAGQPLVCVNCAAIPTELLESTLFGHERGAFTGAAQRQKGVFEQADGGTVFLDEIGELSLPAQAALLRVLETGRFSRVGSPSEITVDVRVVAATHRDLEALRDAGAFRADLYYRLGVLVLAIPPLRERLEDIEPLARRFLARAGRRVRDIAPAALAHLRAYAWPGNVRELRNTIDRAVVLARDEVINADDLPARIRGAASGSVPVRVLKDEPPSSRSIEPGPPSTSAMRSRMQDYESQMLLEMLQAVGWNQSEAARRLGMPLRTFTYKMKALGLKKPGT